MSKSLKYILFRTKHEFEIKTGILVRKYPTSIKSLNISSKVLINDLVSRFPSPISFLGKCTDKVNLKNECQRILKGDIQFFYSEWKHLGLEYDWVTNPSTGYKYNYRQHWTQISDFDSAAGDIKFVWEKSRFCFVYTIIRNDFFNKEDHSDFVVGQILDWIENNPLNCGPNYKCSQEISIRVLNWIFAICFYHPSEKIIDKIFDSIFWQMDHVYKNINFSRIAVRNNHAITETLALYIVGVLFPLFPQSSKWKRNGKKWFEQEIDYQFYDDGSYLQNSVNYQRVVTQLLTLGIAVADKNRDHFSPLVYNRAYVNVNFLFQLMDEQTGMLPNYGANDGALFFPWHEQDYCDYRPQIFDLEMLLVSRGFESLKKQYGIISYNNGGAFIIREKETMTFIRCGGFKGFYPADQQHIDVWINGNNVLMDSGSFKYNTAEETIRYFSGTESHNTIMLNENDQMLKGPRFMWFYPPIVINAMLEESDDEYIYSGSVNCFRQLSPKIIHKRIIRKKKTINEWIIEDEVQNKPDNLFIRQLWHTSNSLNIVSDGYISEEIGYFSRYYGVKNTNRQIEVTSKNNKIITKISI